MYNLDDVGNADRFVDLYGDTLRYVPPFKKWLAWKGTHWEVSIGEHRAAAQEMIRNLHGEAAGYYGTNDGLHKEMMRHIVRSAGRIDTLLKEAAAHADIRTEPKWLDSDRNYLNCRNCTIDLSDGQIMAHKPGDLITKVVKAPYFPNTERPLWEAFLAQVMPEPSVREYLKRLAGYSLLGGTQERLIVFLHGVGRNGKSVFVEVLREVLGDYAVGTPVTTFLQKGGAQGPSNDLARLRGARLVVASEFEEGAKANIALLKQVTGDEKITARPLYGEFFDFPFEGTIWISTNYMPFVGATQAVWDRIKIVEFPVRLTLDEVDVNIKGKLINEASGILCWMIEGAQAYIKYGLEEPESVLLASIRERSEQTPLTLFLEEACDEDISHSCTVTQLFQSYLWWVTQVGDKPMSRTTFGKKLGELGFHKQRYSNGVCWIGVRPKAGVQV